MLLIRWCILIWNWKALNLFVIFCHLWFSTRSGKQLGNRSEKKNRWGVCGLKKSLEAGLRRRVLSLSCGSVTKRDEDIIIKPPLSRSFQTKSTWRTHVCYTIVSLRFHFPFSWLQVTDGLNMRRECHVSYRVCGSQTVSSMSKRWWYWREKWINSEDRNRVVLLGHDVSPSQWLILHVSKNVLVQNSSSLRASSERQLLSLWSKLFLLFSLPFPPSKSPLANIPAVVQSNKESSKGMRDAKQLRREVVDKRGRQCEHVWHTMTHYSERYWFNGRTWRQHMKTGQ